MRRIAEKINPAIESPGFISGCLFRLAGTGIFVPGLAGDGPRATRRLAGVWAEQQTQLVQGLQIIFTAVTNVTTPGGEVGNRDQFIT
jgi:hypothetical protein